MKQKNPDRMKSANVLREQFVRDWLKIQGLSYCIEERPDYEEGDKFRFPRLPYGKATEMYLAAREALGKTIVTKPKDITNAIQEVRRPGSNYENHPDIPIPDDPIYKALAEAGFIRRMPDKEAKACREIINILDSMERGGYGYYVGTPTPWTVFPGNRGYGNDIIDDNLDVAKKICETTDTMEICIGNMVKPEKAEKKRMYWKRLMGRRVPIIRTSGITVDSFKDDIERLANSHDLVKVVFMMSGEWWTGRNRGLDTASTSLVKLHPNVRIIAMAIKNRFDFQVLRYGFPPTGH